jgi:hypothetical protein
MAYPRARRSRETMFQLIEEWESSNLTKKAFSRERQIPISVFHYWCRRFRELDNPGGFVPIEVQGMNDHGSMIEIKYPNGVSLRLPSQTPFPIVRQYLSL